MLKGKVDSLYERILAIECLIAIKKEFTYNVIIKRVGLSPPVLSRYINKRVLPEYSRAIDLIRIFEEKFLKEIIEKKIKVDKQGIFNLSFLRSDILLMGLIAHIIARKFSNVDLDKVLCLDNGGEILGTLTAWALRKPVVIVRRERELGVNRFIEYRFIRSPSVVEYFYIPRGSIASGDKVLLILDIIRSGQSVKALTELVKKVRGEVRGIASLISLEEGVRRVREKVRCPLYTLFSIRTPPP